MATKLMMMQSTFLCLFLLSTVVTNSCFSFSLPSLRRNHPLGTTTWQWFPTARSGTRSPVPAIEQRNYDLQLKASQSVISDAIAERNDRTSRFRFPRFLRGVVLLPIDLLGRLVAAVLARAINHPSVRTALGACIVSGVRQLCEDPDLDDYIDRATATINEDLEDDARELAMAVPKIVRGFFQGLSETTSPSSSSNSKKK